jgi:hypothetical protein
LASTWAVASSAATKSVRDSVSLGTRSAVQVAPRAKAGSAMSSVLRTRRGKGRFVGPEAEGLPVGWS